MNAYCRVAIQDIYVSGHMGKAVFWPTRGEAGQWFTTYDTRGRSTVSTPQWLNGNQV